jgi:cell cycle sensor histidine kinase DivJ
MTNEALVQARAQLSELIEAARAGSIIPVRLPSQLESVQELLTQAQEEEADQAQLTAAHDLTETEETAITENAEFMKTAIHELRTPMTSIRGYADMLSNVGMAGELNDMQSQLLQVIRTNSRRMESLLSDMSYINKIRAGILAVNPKMDLFKNIAQIAEKEARPLAEELNRQLVFDIPQGLPLLQTDGEHLAHALYKLIENGLRYSPEGTGKVTVAAASDGNTLVVTIADNGIGIAPDDLPKLGTPYFRADHDMVRSYKGSGLGIPIAYGLIKVLDGNVSVDSTVDEGTCFTLRFEGMT